MPGGARRLAARAQRRAARSPGAGEPQVSAARARRRLQPLPGKSAARLHHLRVRDARGRERWRGARARAPRHRQARALQVQPDPVQPVPRVRVHALERRAHPALRRDPAARRPYRDDAQDARRRHRCRLRPARRRCRRSHAPRGLLPPEGSARMSAWRAAALAVLIAGCAAQPQAPSSDTGTITGGVSEPRNRARVHTDLAAAYYGRGAMSVALQELRAATDADASYAPAYGLYGLVYQELKENTFAQDSFERGLRLAPNDPDINHHYGWFLCQNGREQEGIRHFMQAVKNPLYQAPWRSYSAAGLCSLRQNNVKDAEDFFQRALKLDPDEPASLLKLGEIRYRQGKPEEARKLVARRNKLVSPSAESLWLALRIERRLGERVAEQSYANQLRRRFPGSPEYQSLQKGQYE